MSGKKWVEIDGAEAQVYDKEEELYCDKRLRQQLNPEQIEGADNNELTLVRVNLRHRVVSKDDKMLAATSSLTGVIFCPHFRWGKCDLLGVDAQCPVDIEQPLNRHLESARFRRQLHQQGLL